jgi:hypothetical protein
MAIIIDNDAIKFLTEFKVLCDKYVSNASLIKVEFKDGYTIGMGTLWRVGLGAKQIEDVI